MTRALRCCFGTIVLASVGLAASILVTMPKKNIDTVDCEARLFTMLYVGMVSPR